MRMRPLPLLLQLLVITCVCVPLVHGVVMMEAVLADSTNTDAPFISLGWQAAAKSLNSHSNAGITSSTLSFSSNAATLGQSIVDAVTAANALMVFGLYDDDATQAVMQSTAFTDANLVLFGPYTQSTGVRTWSDNVYFMSADPMAEILALLNWVFSSHSGGAVQLGNVGFMQLTGGPFSDMTLSTYFANQIALLGLRPPVVYEEARTSAFSGITFNTYMEQNPSCMFLFGARGDHTTMFFTSLISSGQVVGTNFFIMMPFALMYSTSSAYQQQYLVNPSSVVTYGNLIYSAPFPLPNAGQRAASTQFQSDMKAFNGLTGSAPATTSGYLMYYGWNFFEQMMYIAQTYNLGGGLNYAGLKTNVFMQNRYNIMDTFYGNYGGVCNNTATARRLGAACECNQGGHYVAVVQVAAVVASKTDDSGVTLKLSSENFFPNYPCYTNQNVTATLTGFFGTVVSLEDNSAAAAMGSTMQTALTEATNRNKYGQTSPLTFTIAPVSTASAATASASVTAQTAKTTMSVIVGPVSPPFLPGTMPDYFFVEPIEVPVNVERSVTRNALYLSATLRQQIYAVAQYLGTTSIPGDEVANASNRVHARLRTNNDTLCLDMIQRSLSFFNIHLGSGYGLGATVDFFAELPTSGHVFVIGLTPPDLPSLYQYLVNNPSVTIIIAFDELTVYYDTFSSLFGTTVTPVMSRVLFATNVPSWTQTGTSTIFQKFVTNLPSTARSPAAMRAFLATMAVDKITRGRNISSFALARELYQYNSFAIDDLSFGPFYDGCATYPPSAAVHCTVNFGARNISVRNYAHIIQPTNDFVAKASSPPMLYGQKFMMLADTTTATSTTTATPSTSTTTTTTTTTTSTLPPCTLPPKSTSPPQPTSKIPQTSPASKGRNSHVGKFVLIALLGLLVMVGALVAAYLYWNFLPCFNGAPFVQAPYDPESPTTVIFAELSQWADIQRTAPAEAEVCLQKYQRTLRLLAVKHRCYEVGSINDAFMMVARSPNDALQFSMAVHAYVCSMRGPEVDVVQSMASDLPHEDRTASAMCGLRVRVGVHTDVVDIAYDVDTDHYEYRGSGCVAALRTERLAHGGQVLVTGATCEALTEKQLASVHAVSLGPHQYEEYDEPVQLFELVLPCTPEVGSIRSPVSAAVSRNDPLLMMCGDSSGELEAAVSLTREVLTVAHETLPVKARIKVLRAKCAERGLRAPPRARGLPLETYAAVLVDVLARQAMRMAAFGAGTSGGGGYGRWCKRLSDDLSSPELALLDSPPQRRSPGRSPVADMRGGWEQQVRRGSDASGEVQNHVLRE